jgi:hypothetical protein
MASRPRPGDLAAAEALREAGGVCWRCERHARSAVAVLREGRWVVQCLNPARCRRRIREQMKAGIR